MAHLTRQVWEDKFDAEADNLAIFRDHLRSHRARDKHACNAGTRRGRVSEFYELAPPRIRCAVARSSVTARRSHAFHERASVLVATGRSTGAEN
jgi:hypothetical protein